MAVELLPFEHCPLCKQEGTPVSSMCDHRDEGCGVWCCQRAECLALLAEHILKGTLTIRVFLARPGAKRGQAPILTLTRDDYYTEWISTDENDPTLRGIEGAGW